MRLSLLRGFCFALIVVGSAILIYSIYWLAPHPLVALDMPISLSPGPVITGDVKVNLDTLYYIDVEIDRSKMPATVRCEPHSVLGTQWTLSSDGEIKARGSSPWEDSGLTLGVLLSDTEHYAFDANILPGASCLNAGKPRLRIQTHPYPSDLYTNLTWLPVWFISTGLVLLIRFWFCEILGEKATHRIFPDTALRNVIPLHRHRPLPPIKDLPDFGLVLGSLLFILIFIYMTVRPRTPLGLRVNIRERTAVAWQKSPWPETLGVYVDGQGKFYVNGQWVPKENLRTKLSEELGKRMVWTVYFEADNASTVADTICAMDTIQRLDAKLVWITPAVREELNKDAAP
jgi:biopolymer transport protein ExbD